MRAVRLTIRSLALSVLAFGLVAGSTATSRAAASSYFGWDDPKGALVLSNVAYNAFLSQLSVSGTDELEGIGNNTPDPSLTFGATGITATTSGGLLVSFPVLAVSGNNALLELGPPQPGEPEVPLVFDFSEPITAFGSFFSNGGSDVEANAVTFVLENTVLGTTESVSFIPLGPGASFDNVFFAGVTDTVPFNRVTVSESFDFDGMLLDNITVGRLVPEPASWVLAAGGALGMALLGRLRRKR